MLSLKEIRRLNDIATKQVFCSSRACFVAKVDCDINVKQAPRLGDYIPKGFTLVETYFVDISGFGQIGERALTFEQFRSKVKQGYGYGIAETGAFQAYINEFKSIE